MSSAVLVQTNGCGSSFQFVDPVADVVSPGRGRCVWTPRRMSWSVSSPNQRSTWLIQEEPVGVKCRWKRGWRASQSLIAGVLWVAEVVADQVHVQLGGHGLVDGDQELPELDRPVLAVQLGDHGAVGDVERREQAGDAVADVVVGAPLGHAGHHRQHRLGPVQRLHLRLLVHAQHHRPLGLSRPGARCRRLLAGPFPQAARRTRRARSHAHRALHGLCRSGVVAQGPGVGDRVAPVAVSGDRHRGRG